MREQKYADVLKKYEDQLKTIEEAEDETFEKETEEKLSMTREIKFQELQKHIDDTFLKEIEVEDTDDEEDTSPVDQEALKQRFLDFVEQPNQKVEERVSSSVKEKEAVSEKNESSVKQIDDDIYLTTSFQPLRKKFRLKKVFKVLFLIVFFLAILAALGYFVFLPLYHKYIDSKPKMIFEHTIDYVSDELVQLIDKNVVSSDLYYLDLNFKLNTNIDTYDYLTDSRYGFRVAVDPKNKLYENSLYIKEGEVEYGNRYLESDGNAYLHYSTSATFLDLGEVDDANALYNDYASILEEVSVNKEELIYYIEKHASIFKELIDEDFIQSSKEEMRVGETTTTVTRNTFTLEANEYEKIQKRYIELLKEDEKLLKIAASLEEMSVSAYEEFLEDSIEEVDDDYKWSINIYTKNGNQFVGIDEEVNGFRDFYYYNLDGNFEAHLNFTTDEDCLNGKDCAIANQMIYDFVGVKKETYTEVQLKYNNQEIGVLKVKSFTKEKIEFDYSIDYEEEHFTGDLLLYMESHSYIIALSCKEGSEYVRLDMNLNLSAPEEIAIIDKDSIIPYTEKAYEKETNAFIEQLDEIGIAEPYGFWLNFVYLFSENLPSLDDSSYSTSDVPISTA